MDKKGNIFLTSALTVHGVGPIPDAKHNKYKHKANIMSPP